MSKMSEQGIIDTNNALEVQLDRARALRALYQAIGDAHWPEKEKSGVELRVAAERRDAGISLLISDLEECSDGPVHFSIESLAAHLIDKGWRPGKND